MVFHVKSGQQLLCPPVLLLLPAADLAPRHSWGVVREGPHHRGYATRWYDDTFVEQSTDVRRALTSSGPEKEQFYLEFPANWATGGFDVTLRRGDKKGAVVGTIRNGSSSSKAHLKGCVPRRSVSRFAA